MPPAPIQGWALVVVDLQRGFDDPAFGPSSNPRCEANVARLLDIWRKRAWPVVWVRHDSEEPRSPLRPGQPGNGLKPELQGDPDLLVVKHVHSAFYGRPDLDGWLRDRGVEGIVVSGITTDHCCSTTARMASDLGYQVAFAIDATRTFDRSLPDGTTVPAEQVATAVAAELHGEFAQVVGTAEILAQVASRH
ncbi:MAG: cysteine hydrolase family protein [Candidatus Dormibacteraceae bacterium]